MTPDRPPNDAPSALPLPAPERLTRLLTWLALAVLGAFAGAKLTSEFYRLVLAQGPKGANDLMQRSQEVHAWFAGEPVYGAIVTATYPPASYALLWPALGWLELPAARWLWAGLSVAALVWTVRIFLDAAGARSTTSRGLVALIPLSLNATGVSVGNGQWVHLALPLITTALTLAPRGAARPRLNWAVVGLFLIALIKPSLAAPYFLLLLVIPELRRSAVAIAVGYALVSWAAALYQQASPVSLLGEWFAIAGHTASRQALRLDYGSVHSWLAAVGITGWNTVASLALLGACAIWLQRYRNADIWILLGMTSLAARTWTYHGIYDDMLIAVPLIALVRSAGSRPLESRQGRFLIAIVAGTIAVMLLPARLFVVWPSPWPLLFSLSHLASWLLLLVALHVVAKQSEGPAAAGAE